MKINVIETGTDYIERIDTIEADLSGTFAEMVEQAKAIVAERGYRVMSNEEGGNCAVTAYPEHEEIGITVYPA